MHIGNRSFKIPRNIFSNPGDTPNFFTLGFGSFFGAPGDSDKARTFIRPPPIAPPTVPNRSSDLFSDLLAVLQGGSVIVRDDEHRRLLLKECQYYRFRNLEQRLIEHRIAVNRERQTKEITINLENIKVEQLVLRQLKQQGAPMSVFYRRPFVDTEDCELVMQVSGDEQAVLIKHAAPSTPGNGSGTGAGAPPPQWEVVFYDKARDKFNKAVSFLMEKFGFCMGTGMHGYPVNMESAALSVNGRDWDLVGEQQAAAAAAAAASAGDTGGDEGGSATKRRKLSATATNPALQGSLKLVCQRSQWRIVKSQVEGQNNMLTLQLLTAECVSGARYKNKTRTFL